jgi:aryl-alcohol dehydrogenase-like predicted oxidoreductase
MDAVAVLGLGLAALGRPAYITIGHGADLGPDRSIGALEARCHDVCDHAWRAGVRWFDAARSYGRAEEFLGRWLNARSISPSDVTVSSKWGYRYAADWRSDAEVHEVKDHSVEMFERQWAETESFVGRWLELYQVHSATLSSGILDDHEVHRALARLPVRVGLSLTGPNQGEVLRRALDVRVDGVPVFSAVQATWNLLEPSVGPALRDAKDAGWAVIIKEALANGRLVHRSELASIGGVPPDALALAAALAQPWADVVLSGAVTVSQLDSNLLSRQAVAEGGAIDPAALAMTPSDYWSERAALRWN